MQALNSETFARRKDSSMNYTYEGIITKEVDGSFDGYSIVFPDWGGATCGRTLEEAAHMASDFLKAHISSCLVEGEIIPSPSFNHDIGKGTRIYVTIEMNQEKAEEYWAWMPVQAAAEILGITAGRVRVMASSGVLPSIREHGKIYVLRAAVEERKARGAKRGRPALKS